MFRNNCRYSILWIIFFHLLYSNTKAQVSMPSGYYPIDSILIQINWKPSINEIIEYRLNTFSSNDFQRYSGGNIKLYNRSFEKNSWENKIYTNKDCLEPIDTSQKKGALLKANILTVRSRDTLYNQISKDSVYVFALYKNPSKLPTFFVTMNEEEREELMFHFDEKSKIRAWLNLFTPEGKLELSNPIEFRLAGDGSLCAANKGVMLKAKFKEPIFGPRKFKTSLWGKEQKTNIIKLRSGGGGQSKAFSSNEIILKTLASPQLIYQQVESTVGVWYLNGSYWSLTFPQTKIDNRFLSHLAKTSKDKVDILTPFPVRFMINQTHPGCSPYLHPFPFRIDSIISDCVNNLCYQDVLISGDLQGWYRIPINYSQENTLLAISNPKGNERILGLLTNGDGVPMKKFLSSIIQALSSGKKYTVDELNQLFDLDNFLKYIATVNYLDLGDAIHNNIELVASENKKPFIIFEDFDMDLDEESNLNGNNWDFIDIEPNNCLGLIHEIYQKLIFTSPEAVERLQLIYQDLINTTFNPIRTIPIVQQIRDEVMPYYPYNYEAWGGSPNGGLRDSTQQEIFYQDFKDFFRKRPAISLKNLAEHFQSKKKYTLEDRKKITINFDDIKGTNVKVTLNSLQIDSNFIGFYLPSPALNFSYKVIGNDEVYIEEMPHAPHNIRLPLTQNQTITFKLKEK